VNKQAKKTSNPESPDWHQAGGLSVNTKLFTCTHDPGASVFEGPALDMYKIKTRPFEATRAYPEARHSKYH
jgi:hypothetical protein